MMIGFGYVLRCLDTAWIWKGHPMNLEGTWVLHKKTYVSDTILHDRLPILKYLGIVDYA